MNLTKMKAPGDSRPTWRGGVLQIHITRACDLACIACTQGSNLGGKPVIMTLDNFDKAAWSLRDYPGVVGIFGGNPTMHPQFEEICKILQKHVNFENRGLWSNNLNGHGAICRETFNPEVSNLNIHTNKEFEKEFRETWPEARLIGQKDSRHSPPYVAMKDMEDLNTEQIEALIENCDVNQLWSAMICQFRGKLRGFFCELAGAQSMLHENEIGYPDTGLPITDGWWKKDILAFEHQIRKHCFECGVPLRGKGDLAVSGTKEYVSKTHEKIYKLKKPAGKELILVKSTKELGGKVDRATDYIQNGEKMEDVRVLIGIPTQEYARRADFYDYVNMMTIPVGTGKCIPHGQSPARNRNLIISQALEGNFTHVLFIDDDLAFQPDLLSRLLAHNKDIVCGTYLMRHFPHAFIAFDYEDERGRCRHFYPRNDQKGLVEITSTGLGAALIKTDVFRAMIPHCEKTDFGTYDFVRLGQLERDHWCDDIDFWRRVRSLGYKLWLDLDTVLGHMTSVTVWPTHNGERHQVTYESFGTAAVAFNHPEKKDAANP